jgi:hypothetical protein
MTVLQPACRPCWTIQINSATQVILLHMPRSVLSVGVAIIMPILPYTAKLMYVVKAGRYRIWKDRFATRNAKTEPRPSGSRHMVLIISPAVDVLSNTAIVVLAESTASSSSARDRMAHQYTRTRMTLSHRLNGTSMYDSIAVRWIDNDIPSNDELGLTGVEGQSQ